MSEVPEVDVTQLAKLRDEGDVTLIDVREPDEYDGAHVPGARLIHLGTVPDHVGDIDVNGGPVYVICAMRGRCRKAADYLRGQGIDAVNVAGGTNAWIEAGQPTDAGMES